MPDLFLSYAHVDKHWVDTFAPLLEQRVNQYVGRAKVGRIWKDNRLTGNEPFSPEIHEQLNSAHCLVACLSTGYFASEWCMREITEFSQRMGNRTGCIFCVEVDELPLHQKPSQIAQMLGYRFWSQDSLSKRSYPLRSEDCFYESILIDLAKDIAKKLLEQEAPSEVTHDKKILAPSYAHTQKVIEGNAFTATPQEKKNGVSTALIIRRDRLRKMLNRLEEQYDLETREEERMRMERIIEEKRTALNQIEAQLIG